MNNSQSLDTCEQLDRIGWGKNKCESKAYLHKACLNRNRIMLCVNKEGRLSRYLGMLFLPDQTFVR